MFLIRLMATRNPAVKLPVEGKVVYLPLFIRFYTSQVVGNVISSNSMSQNQKLPRSQNIAFETSMIFRSPNFVPNLVVKSEIAWETAPVQPSVQQGSE